MHWGPVIPALAKQRTVISLDYSGSGETVDDGRTLSLETLANQVVGVAEAAGLQRFDLVGHSLGAAVAIQVAALNPGLVRSITAVAGFALGSEPRLQLQFGLWLDLLRANRAAFLRLLLLTGLTPKFVSGLGLSTINDMVDGYMPFANWDGIRRQVELDLAVDVREQVSKIESPALVVHCAHDQIVTQTPALAASIADSTFRQINAGHLAYFEAGEEFVSLLMEFLGRNRGGAV
jgi:pimeloyl-ACP methyl ester carboxylesterase